MYKSLFIFLIPHNVRIKEVLPLYNYVGSLYKLLLFSLLLSEMASSGLVTLWKSNMLISVNFIF